MDSHILLPKCILKHFAIEERANESKFFCLDLSKDIIKVASPKSFNTEKDYYSKFVEDLLSSQVEQELGKFIKKIKIFIYEGVCKFKYSEVRNVMIQYAYSLHARSAKMLNEIVDNLIFADLYTKQSLHDMAVIDSMAIMNQDKFLDDFEITFIVNESDIPFVLPGNGLYSTIIDEFGKVVFIPIENKICLCLFEKTKKEKISKNGKIIMPCINESIVQRLNNLAYNMQEVIRQGGSLICSNKQELERLKGLKNEK